MQPQSITKLKNILIQRALNQNDLIDLIEKTNEGHTVLPYIVSGIVSGKRRNYSINTAILISNALNVLIDDIVD